MSPAGSNGIGTEVRPVSASQALDRVGFFFMSTILLVYTSTCKGVGSLSPLCCLARIPVPFAPWSTHARMQPGALSALEQWARGNSRRLLPPPLPAYRALEPH